MDKIITVLGYKNVITEMSDAPDCARIHVIKMTKSSCAIILLLHVNDNGFNDASEIINIYCTKDIHFQKMTLLKVKKKLCIISLYKLQNAVS